MKNYIHSGNIKIQLFNQIKSNIAIKTGIHQESSQAMGLTISYLAPIIGVGIGNYFVLTADDEEQREFVFADTTSIIDVANFVEKIRKEALLSKLIANNAPQIILDQACLDSSLKSITLLGLYQDISLPISVDFIDAGVFLGLFSKIEGEEMHPDVKIEDVYGVIQEQTEKLAKKIGDMVYITSIREDGHILNIQVLVAKLMLLDAFSFNDLIPYLHDNLTSKAQLIVEEAKKCAEIIKTAYLHPAFA